jgi:hypothetical protein
MKMTGNPNDSSTVVLVLQFIKDSFPMIITMGAVWKTISEIAKAYSKKQDAKLRELIKAEVNPQIDNLTHAINELRETIGAMKGK